MLKARIEQDFKAAMLGGDKKRAEILSGLKSVILYEEVAKKARDTGLSDDAIVVLISREAKKRVEAAELYKTSGAPERAQAELAEKAVIDQYLPQQLSDEELQTIIDEVVASMGPNAQLGAVIGAVRGKVGASADGSRIALAVKTKLQ
jgi:hypothetical protein